MEKGEVHPARLDPKTRARTGAASRGGKRWPRTLEKGNQVFANRITNGACRPVVPGLVLLFICSLALADEPASVKPKDWEKRLEQLRSLPYLAFSEISSDEGDMGVLLHDTEKAFPGYNLYSSKLLNKTMLLDMNGRTVHEWRYGSPGDEGPYHYAVMLEDGDVLVIIRAKELLRLNWDSEVIWKKELAAHHDVAQVPDGSFYVLVGEQRPHRGIDVNFDAIVHLSADGEELDRWSSYEHLAELKDALDSRSFLDTILDSALAERWQEGDDLVEMVEEIARRHTDLSYFHTNTVNLLPATPLGGRDARFREGNLLVCFRNVNQIAVLEQGTYGILWAWGEGELEHPHHPTMLPDGHILIFDNGVFQRRSRVVELDPVGGGIVWEYKEEEPWSFYSQVAGSAQRLPNGNTLICDSERGKVFEVTGEEEQVWLWQNPISKPEPQPKPVVSPRMSPRETVYRMVRVPAAPVEKLLATAGPGEPEGQAPSGGLESSH